MPEGTNCSTTHPKRRGERVSDKKTDAKFTIKFSRTDPLHIQVTDILNQQERGGKAQYIVDAVIHFVNSGGVRETQHPRPVQVDEKHIEAIVKRILRDSQKSSESALFAPVATPVECNQPLPQTQPAEEIIYDNAVEELGEECFNIVANTLVMFRRKQ